MDWTEQLEALAKKTKAPNWQAPPNEEATKMALVAPFLRTLGYDVFNTAEVMPEFSADLPLIKKGERVDYAILENNQPRILVEVKAYRTNLDGAERGQLQRYFHATKARIGILTNGHVFQFFADLDEVNKMDEKPFAEVNLLNLRHAPLSQLKYVTKPKFNLNELLGIAEELKYIKGVKDEIRQELTEPSDWLVREMAKRVHSARQIRPQILDSFRPIVADAIQSYIADRINETLDTAIKTVEVKKQDHHSDEHNTAEAENSNNIITTEEETEALYIVKAICSNLVDSDRLLEKDTKKYCNITLDGNPRKSFLRLYFNFRKKRITIFDQDQPEDVPLTAPSDLYQYKERIRKALNLKLEPSRISEQNNQDFISADSAGTESPKL
ncbi:MAG: type I restriction enzyme HsdR N-terminal domain-containing protein [Cyanobacteria bacterium MAG CAR3_bin_5]|nr:type I restriction enzyme HsdR N-terminal domain-containing protein [Cyanobacteria bacterium MAG CAR3_bin_5]